MKKVNRKQPAVGSLKFKTKCGKVAQQAATHGTTGGNQTARTGGTF